MKKLILVMVLAAAAAACNRASDEKAKPEDIAAPDPTPQASLSPAGEKKTWIYFTKNFNKGTAAGQYNTDCVGIVATETIGSRRGNKITWQVHPSNGQNDDDRCDGLDMGSVNLRFQTDVMGAMAMKKLTANSGGVIQGNVSMADDDIGAIIAHKYQVYVGDAPAGPDPIIVVDCDGCGPPPPTP